MIFLDKTYICDREKQNSDYVVRTTTATIFTMFAGCRAQNCQKSAGKMEIDGGSITSVPIGMKYNWPHIGLHSLNLNQVTTMASKR